MNIFDYIGTKKAFDVCHPEYLECSPPFSQTAPPTRCTTSCCAKCHDGKRVVQAWESAWNDRSEPVPECVGHGGFPPLPKMNDECRDPFKRDPCLKRN